jgi:hypothetical protein
MPEEYRRSLRSELEALRPDQIPEDIIQKMTEERIAELPDFRSEYQTWYSEAKTFIKQILPERLADSVRHYEKPKGRKEITYENYTIEDSLQGLVVTRGYKQEKVVGADAAITRVRQQVSILRSATKRFESSLSIFSSSSWLTFSIRSSMRLRSFQKAVLREPQAR